MSEKERCYKNIMDEINARNEALCNGVKELTAVFEKYKKQLEAIKNGSREIKSSATK